MASRVTPGGVPSGNSTVEVITNVVLPIVIVALLVAVNGVFVAAEFALVGARPTRLQSYADDGSSAARWLLDLFERVAGKDSYIAVAQLVFLWTLLLTGRAIDCEL